MFILKNIIKTIKKDNYFDEDHHILTSGAAEIIQEEITNPRREMLGTRYIIKKKDTEEYGVIEILNDESGVSALYECRECVIEKTVYYKII